MTACGSPDRDPTHMHPDLQTLWNEFKTRNAAKNREVFLTATWRNPADQLAQWMRGRNADGTVIDETQVVTNAKPGQSPHECTMGDDGVTPGARAFDFAIQLGDEGNELDWDANDDDWTDAITIGESLGLINGKNFKDAHGRPLGDADHFELPNWRNYLSAGRPA